MGNRLLIIGGLLWACSAPVRAEGLRLDEDKVLREGGWTYRFELRHPGTRSEGRYGKLFMGGKPALVPSAKGSFCRTPWGPMVWVGDSDVVWGDHGWMPQPADSIGTGEAVDCGRTQGKAAAKGASLEGGVVVSEEADSTQVHLPVGQRLTVRLPGNPTTGYSWEVAETAGPSAALQGGVEYAPAPEQPGLVGSGGTFQAVFKAASEGRSGIKLAYRRPWEKGTAPARTFNVELVAFTKAARLDEAADKGVLLLPKGAQVKLKLTVDDETLTQEMIRPKNGLEFVDADFKPPRMAEGSSDSRPEYLQPYHLYTYKAKEAGEGEIRVRFRRDGGTTGPAVKIVKDFRVFVRVYQP
ncbi:MAG: protease inhibitor I42 family protein [Elusimicrobiota bacterium]|jgi:inhibitor of cysteine peptidase